MERGLFDTAELNTQLFLNNLGLEYVPDCLRAYINVRCLFLNDNSIADATGLSCFRNLQGIYLQVCYSCCLIAWTSE